MIPAGWSVLWCDKGAEADLTFKFLSAYMPKKSTIENKLNCSHISVVQKRGVVVVLH